MARLTETQAGDANELRFPDLIDLSESTWSVKGSADHPRRLITLLVNCKSVTSSAAGR